MCLNLMRSITGYFLQRWIFVQGVVSVSFSFSVARTPGHLGSIAPPCSVKCVTLPERNSCGWSHHFIYLFKVLLPLRPSLHPTGVCVQATIWNGCALCMGCSTGTECLWHSWPFGVLPDWKHSSDSVSSRACASRWSSSLSRVKVQICWLLMFLLWAAFPVMLTPVTLSLVCVNVPGDLHCSTNPGVVHTGI